MEKSIVLGTSENMDKVNEIVKEIGFNREHHISPNVRNHDNLEMRTQIHSPSYFREEPEIRTEIEFNNYENDSRNHFEILGKLHERIPDLVYRKPFAIEGKESEIYHLGNLLKNKENYF